jgi:bacteriocin biosynthesis cyclodehydratase domain-containing protein
MSFPRISRHYSVIGHSADCVELRAGVWNPVSSTLTDDQGAGHLFNVLSALDGTISVADIARKEGLGRDEVEAVLDQLRELGALEESPRSALDYYLDTVAPGLKTADGPPEGHQSSVLLLGDKEIAEQVDGCLCDSLPEGIEVSFVADNDPLNKIIFDPNNAWLLDGIEFYERVQSFSEWRNKLVITAATTINPIAFRTLNRISLHLGFPWLHAALDGPFVLVGPLFVPRRTSCFECFETRVMMNLRESGSYQRYKNALTKGHVRQTRIPTHRSLTSLLAAYTAMEALNYLLTGSTFTAQKLMALYLPTMEMAFNDVLRVPSCPGCGSQPERDDKELFFGLEMVVQRQSSDGKR